MILGRVNLFTKGIERMDIEELLSIIPVSLCEIFNT
jgi:hypothetical protein